MVFGQLVMPVECCAGAPAARRRAPAQYCTGMTNWPNTIHCLMSLGINLGAQNLGPNSRKYLSPIFVVQLPEITESLRGGASQKSAPGGLGGWKPPRNSRGLGCGSPPVRTVLWTQSQDFGTRIYREPIESIIMMHLS